MALYLVTGGAGFIGSHLVEALLSKGEAVRVLDNLSTGRRSNLDPFLSDIEFIEGDIRSYHIVTKAMRGVDYVLHQAALPSVPRSIHDPITTNEVNVTGTLNLLHAAVEAKSVQRFVYASSSSVYGNTEVSPKVETLPPAPRSPYAISKLTGEQYCKVFAEIYHLETVALRYFNVFGPRQDPNSPYAAVIPKFLTALKTNQPPKINGDGQTSRDFTYVKNNVTANLLACKAPDVSGKVFNIACGESFTLLDLTNTLSDLTGIHIPPVHLPPRPGDIQHSLADIQLAKTLLGYFPEYNFHEGLKILVESF